MPAPVEPTSEDPYERELDRFSVLQPPLVVQQLTSGDRNYVLFATGLEANFCLKSARQRRQPVRETYQPVARRLRRQEIDDFELFVVPAEPGAPRRSQAVSYTHLTLPTTPYV